MHVSLCQTSGVLPCSMLCCHTLMIAPQGVAFSLNLCRTCAEHVDREA